jgi:hypothetical protein
MPAWALITVVVQVAQTVRHPTVDTRASGSRRYNAFKTPTTTIASTK